jgi:hypothetical protein
MAIPTSSPIIYQSNADFSNNAVKSSFKDKLKKHLPKIIMAALVVGIVIELFVGIRTLTRPTVKRADATNTIGVGKIVLDSARTNYAVGDSVPVVVRIVTSGRATDSTDLILKYDPNILEATSSSIANGTIYKDYVISEVDSAAGTVSVSAITPPNTEGFVGTGEFSTINFKAKKEGTTAVTVDFSKGSTTDSNIVETGVAIDILDEVYNLNLAIGAASSSESAPPESCDGYYQYCQNIVGQTGRQFCSKGRKVDNVCTFDPKLSTSCDICRLGY